MDQFPFTCPEGREPYCHCRKIKQPHTNKPSWKKQEKERLKDALYTLDNEVKSYSEVLRERYEKIKNHLKMNMYFRKREWHYKDICPPLSLHTLQR